MCLLKESETAEILKMLSSKALSYLQEGFYLCAPLYKEHSSIDIDVQYITSQLFTSTHMTSESMLLLVSEYRLWDSEILFRSVIEGTLRYLFIFSGKEVELYANKATEFWHVLPDIKMLSNHHKILSVLEHVDKEHNNWKPYVDLLIPDDVLEDLKSKYPKKVRRSIEQKWSFSEIVKTLSEIEKSYEKLPTILYNYSLASSLIHQDSYSLKIIHDRVYRDDERRNSLELAHGARLISSILHFSNFKFSTYFEKYKLDINPIEAYLKEQNPFIVELELYYKEWFEIEYNNATI